MSTDTDILMEMQRALGRIEQKVDGQTAWAKQHVEDDRRMAADIAELRGAHDRQRGAIKVIVAIGTGLGAALGWVVEKMMLAGGNH